MRRICTRYTLVQVGQIDVSYVSSCRRGSTDSSGYSILQQIPAVHVWLWTSSPYIRPGKKKKRKKRSKILLLLLCLSCNKPTKEGI